MLSFGGDDQTTTMPDEKKLRAAFDAFDVDGSGSIDDAELKRALEAAGLMPSLDECLWLIKQVDKNASGEVEWDEFGKLVELVDTNAYASQVGGNIKLMKLRNQDINKYPRPSAKWAKVSESDALSAAVLERDGSRDAADDARSRR